MPAFAIAILCISGAVMLFGFFMLYRNNVVYEYRMKANREAFQARNFERYDRLPSYDVMFWQLTTFNWDHIK